MQYTEEQWGKNERTKKNKNERQRVYIAQFRVCIAYGVEKNFNNTKMKI